MNTGFPGFSSPAASTEVPLEMLAACHIRIERQCLTLTRLASHLIEHGPDEQARTAAANVLRYFDTAAVQHHADEEENLFPALLESMAGSDAVCLRQLTQGLAAEHCTLQAQWNALRKPLGNIAQGQPAALPQHEIDAFVNLYTQHMKKEDDELFPMAARLLSDNDLTRIGLAMRIRRGILDN